MLPLGTKILGKKHCFIAQFWFEVEFGVRLVKSSSLLESSKLQSVPRHWTPENLAKSQALYRHELAT